MPLNQLPHQNNTILLSSIMKLTRNIHLCFFFFVLAITQSTAQSNTTGDVITITKVANVTKPGCQTQCGNAIIPYPFGIGPVCFLSKLFEITCNTTFNPPRPQIGTRQVLEFTGYTFLMSNKVASVCYDQFGNITKDILVYTNLPLLSPFSFSQKINLL